MNKKTDDKNVIKKGSTSEVQSISHHSLSPFEEMDRLFDNLMSRRWMSPLRWEMPSMTDFGMSEMKSPKIDVIDRDNEVVVRAEAAGVKKEDLDLSIGENSVIIKGTTSHEEKEEKGNYFRSEISRGSFSRTVALPADVDTDKTKAVFNDGIVELTIPKVEKSKRKSVDIE